MWCRLGGKTTSKQGREARLALQLADALLHRVVGRLQAPHLRQARRAARHLRVRRLCGRLKPLDRVLQLVHLEEAGFSVMR